MKKIYFLIGALILILALLIGASFIIDKKLEDDASFISDHIDVDKLETVNNIVQSKNKSAETASALTEMAVTAKETQLKKLNDSVYKHEIIVTDLGELKVDALLSDEEWQKRLDCGINQANINLSNKECSGLFYYDQIDPSLKQLYLEIYISLNNFVESFYVCSVNPDDIDYAFNCVMGDHPDIFYTNGYMFTKYTFGDDIVKIEFSPAYTMSKKESDEYMKRVKEYKEAFLKGIDKNADDYTKIKYTYEFIIYNTEYDLNAPQNQNILSVFVYGKSVCQGYSKAFQYLASSLGITSTLVVGYVGNNEGHAWNMVKCNGAYYYIDCTWGDSSYLENSFSIDSGGINFDYLNITTKELEITHVIDNFASLPICDKTEENYYVKEGLYFTELNEPQISLAFENAKMMGKDTIEFKCADIYVYNQMGEYLLNQNHIFDYLSSDMESIKFMQNSDLYIYCFPLN